MLVTSANAQPPGQVISNQATVDFINSSGLNQAFNSNVVDVVLLPSPSTSALELTRVLTGGTGDYVETVGPSACLQGAVQVPLGNPVLTGGTVIDPTIPQQVAIASSYNLGEPIFFRLTDTDQNFDYQAIDYATVTITHPVSGDTESVVLAETGLDTGIFAGFIPSASGAAVTNDCVLQGGMNSSIVSTYTDPGDPADVSSVSAGLDPVGVVFESRTGSLVDGVDIEIVDDVTGLPATVYGNDGISSFPSLITTGSTVTDGSGLSYVFGPGEFRFPVVPPGNYRLVVTPPTDYAAPSTADIADLQLLPGAPYALGPGSFGASFTVTDSGPLNLDIPVDPQATALFLQKSTLTTQAAPGDFVRYELSIENASSSGLAVDVTIIDQLPTGVRFVPGTVTRDDNPQPDPVIDMNNGTLTFDIGDLAIDERARIFYVVEIIGGKRNDELVNRATAFAGGGLISNDAQAIIRLTEDLFRSTSTIIGRVVAGSCTEETFSEDQGVPNIRIYLEDGRYAVSDDSGRFHFEGLKPGTHVAQIDPVSVPDYYEIVGCNTAGAFAGRADSQFVRLTPGSLTRADFYLRQKEAPRGQVNIELLNFETDSTEQAGFKMRVDGNGNVDVSNLDVMLLLPPGVSYEPGTLRVGGEEVGEPRIAGPSLTISLPDKNGNWTEQIEFVGNISADTQGELPTRAFAKFDTPIEKGKQTPTVETRMIREAAVQESAGYVLNLNFDVLSAELSTADALSLGILIEEWQGVSDIKIQAVGHSDSDPITSRNQHLFADNYVLSAARALAAASFLAESLGVPPENIQVEGRGADDPIASNATAAGKRQNRRVELVVSGMRHNKPSFLEVTQATSGTEYAETQGAVPGEEQKRIEAQWRDERERSFREFAKQEEPPITSMEPGIEMILPAEGYLPPLPVTRVSIKHGVDQTAKVFLNGKAITSLNFDGLVSNVDQTLAISRWAGVDLKDGVNTIRAVIEDEAGNVVETIERELIFTGAPIRGEIVPEKSVLVADGKTRPVLAVRFFDRTGERTRSGSAGTFGISAPYRSWWEVEDQRRNHIVEIGNRQPLYRVEDDGIALIELAPTTRSGEAVLTLNFENNRQQELRVWLSAAQREWILVGFGEGTVGYNTLEDNMTAAMAAGHDDGYYDDGRVAFFAKGSIKGEYLLTLAFDSARDRDESRDNFETVVDPNQYYPLYADTSEQRFEAASQRKIFVKLEKERFFALFGDFNTGLSYTNLARYERRMNGLHSEYRGDNVGYTVFASETDQSFVRDEIRGDGTSGLYYLSSAPIIGNSDQVRIEIRDRFDTGTVLSTQTLTRFLDYNIDIIDGTLFFKRPIPSRDQDLNPVYIVAEYESFSDANEGVIAGGRGSLHFLDNDVEVGATYINDGQEGSEADLTGLDVRWQINDETEFRAEVASSNREELGIEEEGTAYAAEVKHQSEKVDVRAYMREVEDGYGLGSQSAAETGIRKVGIDGRVKFKSNWNFEGEATWQQNLVTETIRNTARGRLRYEASGFNAFLGLVHAEDEFDDGDTRTSQLVEAGVSKQLGDITLRATGNFAVNESDENIDFPASYLFGVDYKILPGVDLFAEYEDATGADIDAQMTRVGVRATPWHRAQLNSSVTNESTEFGPRVFATVGLVQGFKLSENWVLDIGVDSTETIVGPNARPFDPDRELASGSFNEDFAAYFLGATYNGGLWSANGRFELRDSDTSQRSGLIAGWFREPAMGHSMSAGLTALTDEQENGDENNTAALRYGWAWRKADSRWSFLNRIDLIYEKLVLADQEQDNHRLINNFNANRRINERSQLSLQYAFKFVEATFDTVNVSGYTDLIGIDYRYGINHRWDVGVHTSVYQSHESDIIDYGAGLDVGFNIRDNMWITLGYNFIGFHDSDFTEARYTAAGPFLRLSIKTDQYLLKRISGGR